jgi:hypothetical protein
MEMKNVLGIKTIPQHHPAENKYDTRVGFFLTEDRVKDLEDKWFSEQKNIEREDFRAIFDLENLSVGWLNFPQGAAPDTKLVAPGEDWGEAPSKQHKLGLRLLLLKLDETIDNSVRELMSTSVGLWSGIDRIHDAYEAGLRDHPGMLPVVVMTGAVRTDINGGTSFEPVLKIESWAPRPPELPEEGIPLATMGKKSTNKHDDMDDAISF